MHPLQTPMCAKLAAYGNVSLCTLLPKPICQDTVCIVDAPALIQHDIQLHNDKSCAFNAAGHSLGGAVALLCALRLLQGLSGSAPSLQCICFGTPAIGNAALAAVVAEYGWESHILNFILPGTPCMSVCTRLTALNVLDQTCYIGTFGSLPASDSVLLPAHPTQVVPVGSFLHWTACSEAICFDGIL